MKKRILTYLLALLAVLTMLVPTWADQTEDDLFIYDTVGNFIAINHKKTHFCRYQ